LLESALPCGLLLGDCGVEGFGAQHAPEHLQASFSEHHPARLTAAVCLIDPLE
jgi:hypothetical protein